jgi:hypothetical protein
MSPIDAVDGSPCSPWPYALDALLLCRSWLDRYFVAFWVDRWANSLREEGKGDGTTRVFAFFVNFQDSTLSNGRQRNMQVQVFEKEVDNLIRFGLLEADARHDRYAVREALHKHLSRTLRSTP